MAAATRWTIYCYYSTNGSTADHWTTLVYGDGALPVSGSSWTVNTVENTNAGSLGAGTTNSLRINTALYAGLRTILNKRADGL